MRKALAVAAVPLAAVAAVVVVRAAPAGAAATPVLSRKIIGYSVKHRPIVAYHLGNPRSSRTAVILGQMHGDEHAGVVVANSIVRGTVSIEGLNLWVIPTMNPDGDAAHTRGNAHRVDLNRNWPRRWRHLTGEYYSGRKALSEPETRAVYRFLRSVRPQRLVVLHQPLYGVDTTDGGRIDRAFVDRLARKLGYPKKAFNCWSVCYGSLTDWYTARRLGRGFTVEFGWHPRRAFLTGRARTGIIAALGGRFGSLAAHDPRSSLTASASAGGAVRVRGWVFDPDARGTSLRYATYRDGTLVGRGTAAQPSAAANQRYGLTGAHGVAIDTTAAPGPHVYCLTFTNVGAGSGNPRRCVTVAVPAPPTSPPPGP
jgi:murein peptide amidase A